MIGNFPPLATAGIILVLAAILDGLIRLLLRPRDGHIRGPIASRAAYLIPMIIWAISLVMAWRATGWVIESAAEYAVAISLVVGLVVSQVFGNLSAGLICILSDLVRIGEMVQVGGDLFLVSKRTIISVQGTTPSGELKDVPWRKVLENTLTNWSRVEFARGQAAPLFICDRKASNAAVIEAVYSVILENEKYSILDTEHGGDAPIGEEHHAFIKYAADSANAREFHIYFFTRRRADLPGLAYDLNLDIRDALDKADIAYGQVGHLFLENERLQVSG